MAPRTATLSARHLKRVDAHSQELAAVSIGMAAASLAYRAVVNEAGVIDQPFASTFRNLLSSTAEHIGVRRFTGGVDPDAEASAFWTAAEKLLQYVGESIADGLPPDSARLFEAEMDAATDARRVVIERALRTIAATGRK